MRTSVIFVGLPLALLSTAVVAQEDKSASAGGFNPKVSLVLDGRYTDIDSSTLALAGFQVGGEASLPENGFSTGHNELTISSNIDDQFYGELTAAIVRENGTTETELEEAYIETLKLGSGLTIKAGRFFSDIGYLNNVHDHAHDFTDRPLVYDALFGGHLTDTGIQADWVVPTDMYLRLGTEMTTGSEFPGGENTKGNKGFTFFAKTGGDISASSSWQAGASYYQSEFDKRTAGGHSHGGSTTTTTNELLNGKVEISGVDFVYKWAPYGNSKNTNFKLQAEYFVRQESGNAKFTEGSNNATADYDGDQNGWYLQAIYQFKPAWRVGLRYDRLHANNSITNFVDGGVAEAEFLEESGLGAEADPNRSSIMFDYSPSHFSRIRLQYSQFENGHGTNNDSISVQYIMALGAHSAHSF